MKKKPRTPKADKAKGCFDKPIKIDSINKLDINSAESFLKSLNAVQILRRLEKDSEDLLEYVENNTDYSELEEEQTIQSLVEIVSNLNLVYGDLQTYFYPRKTVVKEEDIIWPADSESWENESKEHLQDKEREDIAIAANSESWEKHRREHFREYLQSVEKEYAVKDTSMFTKFFAKCSAAVKKAFK